MTLRNICFTFKGFRQAVVLMIFIVFFASTNSFSQGYRTQRTSGGFSAGAFAGPSLLAEKAPDTLFPELQDYFNNLRSGWHYGFETEYFFNKYVGVGAKYIRFSSKQEVDSIVVKFFSTTLYIDLSNDIIVHTLSPMAYGRLPLFNDKLAITAGVGPAWLLYRNIGKAVGDSAMFKGSSPGVSTSVRISYEIVPNLNLGVQTSYIHAFLKKITQDDGTTEEVILLDKKDYQNISRFDFSFGIFYTFRSK